MFRFTIRDVLWLTAVVALTVLLAMEHRRATLATMAWHYWEKEAQPKVERELLNTTSLSCRLMPLKDVAQYLSDKHDILITLDSSVDGEVQITRDVPLATLKKVLETVLSPHELSFRINKGVIVIEPAQNRE